MMHFYAIFLFFFFFVLIATKRRARKRVEGRPRQPWGIMVPGPELGQGLQAVCHGLASKHEDDEDNLETSYTS